MTRHHIKANNNKVECTLAVCRYLDTIGTDVLIVTANSDITKGDVGLTKYGKVEVIYVIKKWIPAEDKQFLINSLGELKFIRNKFLNYQQIMEVD